MKKNRKLTALEKELADLLLHLVMQNCSKYVDGDDHIYESGFIRSHSDAMRLLCKLGLMQKVYDGYPTRAFEAKLTEDEVVLAAFS